MRKFKHYAFQTIMIAFGTTVAGMIVFTFITIFNEML